MAPPLVEPKSNGGHDGEMTSVLKRQIAMGYALVKVSIGGGIVMVLAGMLFVGGVKAITGGYPSSPLAGVPVLIIVLYAFSLYAKIVLPVRY